MKFKVQVPAAVHWRSTRIRNRKLTAEQVREIRAWSQREGWGQPRERQAAILAPRYRVAPRTVVDVLANTSWFDASYVPGHCDKTYWGRLTPFVAMLRICQGHGLEPRKAVA